MHENNKQIVKIEIEIPLGAYNAAKEYARACNQKTETILRKALISRLKDLTQYLKNMPLKPGIPATNPWWKD